jgi:hypothetical protein
MKREMVSSALGFAFSAMFAATTAAQTEPDRPTLPIPEPQSPHSSIFNARHATPPPRVEVKAPAEAPNVLLISEGWNLITETWVG